MPWLHCHILIEMFYIITYIKPKASTILNVLTSKIVFLVQEYQLNYTILYLLIYDIETCSN